MYHSISLSLVPLYLSMYLSREPTHAPMQRLEPLNRVLMFEFAIPPSHYLSYYKNSQGLLSGSGAMNFSLAFLSGCRVIMPIFLGPKVLSDHNYGSDYYVLFTK